MPEGNARHGGSGQNAFVNLRWRLTAVTCVAAIVAVAVAGCADEGSSSEDGASKTVPTFESPHTTGGAALLVGTLELNGTCVFADDALIIWPFGAVLREGDPPVVELPDGGEVPIDGDEDQYGGGFIAESGVGVEELSPEAQDCLDRLGLASAWLLFGDA